MREIKASRDSIVRILRAMSLYEARVYRGGKRAKGETRKLSPEFRLSLFIVWLPLSLSLGIALLARLAFEWLAAPSLAMLLVSYVGLFVWILSTAFSYRKSLIRALQHPFALLLRNAAETMLVDLRYASKLEKKPLRLLEITALEIKAEKEFFERRISTIVGTIEKLGLIPGLGAAMIAIYQLPTGINVFVQSIAYAVPALYLFGGYAHFELMRLDRFSKVLELTIIRARANPAELGSTTEAKTAEKMQQPMLAKSKRGRKQL
jgi:hypothetical protein